MDSFFSTAASSKISNVIFTMNTGFYLLNNGTLLYCGASYVPGFLAAQAAVMQFPLKAGEAVVYMTCANSGLVIATTNSIVITNYTSNTILNYST